MKTLLDRLMDNGKKNKFTQSLESKKEFDKAIDKLHKENLKVNKQPSMDVIFIDEAGTEFVKMANGKTLIFSQYKKLIQLNG